MKEKEDNQIPSGKIFKEKAFWVGTFLGGPLVAGYLLSENFKLFNQPEKVKPTWIITVIFTIVIIGGVFLIPENINIPNQIIPLVYSAIAYGLFKKFQEEKANQHLSLGGLVHSWWKVIGIGIIGLLIITLPIFAIAYVYETVEQENVTTKSYGITKHEIDFDLTNISEIEVDNIAAGLNEVGFFDLSMAKYAYVSKNGHTYEISIPTVEGIEKNAEGIAYFKTLQSQLNEYLTENKVEIILAVDYMDNVVMTIK